MKMEDLVIFIASCWALIRYNHRVYQNISCIFPIPLFWAKVCFWILCKFGKRIIMRIILTFSKSKSRINYLVIWKINNLYTNGVVGFSIIKYVFVMRWFLAKGNKSAIYSTRPITLF